MMVTFVASIISRSFDDNSQTIIMAIVRWEKFDDYCREP